MLKDTPYWWDTAPELPRLDYHALPAKADVVIVGSGYTGLSAARVLALRGVTAVVLEKETFGIDHQELGYIIAIKWKFPDDFAQVIRHHHESYSNNGRSSLIRLVKGANSFAHANLDPQSPEGFILEKEKGKIDREVDKIMEFLRLG